MTGLPAETIAAVGTFITSVVGGEILMVVVAAVFLALARPYRGNDP